MNFVSKFIFPITIILLVILMWIHLYLRIPPIEEINLRERCPPCEACPEQTNEIPTCPIPNSQQIIDHIRENILVKFRDRDDDQQFLKNYIHLSSLIEGRIRRDVDLLISKLKGDLVDDFSRIELKNFHYLEKPTRGGRERFLREFGIKEYPEPLVTFSGVNMKFGYLPDINKWKIFIDREDLRFGTLSNVHRWKLFVNEESQLNR